MNRESFPLLAIALRHAFLPIGMCECKCVYVCVCLWRNLNLTKVVANLSLTLQLVLNIRINNGNSHEKCQVHCRRTISLTESIAYYLYTIRMQLVAVSGNLRTLVRMTNMCIYVWVCVSEIAIPLTPPTAPALVHSENHLATVFVWQIYKNNWNFICWK